MTSDLRDTVYDLQTFVPYFTRPVSNFEMLSDTYLVRISRGAFPGITMRYKLCDATQEE
jgi:hypothetical protein